MSDHEWGDGLTNPSWETNTSGWGPSAVAASPVALNPVLPPDAIVVRPIFKGRYIVVRGRTEAVYDLDTTDGGLLTDGGELFIRYPDGRMVRQTPVEIRPRA